MHITCERDVTDLSHHRPCTSHAVRENERYKKDQDSVPKYSAKLSGYTQETKNNETCVFGVV